MKKVLSLICVLALAVSCLFALTSCFGATPNADPEAAKASLESAGYTVYLIGDKLTATKGEDAITIDYCATEEAAQAIYDGYVAMEELAKELGEDMGGDYGISGKMVWVGTSDAISAAK